MKKYFILTFTLLILILYFFYNSKEAIFITKENIDLFLNILLPNLFPYMILVLLFINYKCHLIIAYLIQYISIPFFKISGKSFSIILIGILGGYPLIALLAKEIINKKNEKELNKLVPLFSYPSLSFLLNVIDINCNINFLFFYLISSILILFIFRDNERKEYISYQDLKKDFKNTDISFIQTFSKTLFKSLNNLGLIFSNLLFFSLFKTLFNFKNEKINYLYLSLFEFSKSSIYFSNNLQSNYDVILLGIMLLLGGLNIIMQIFIIYNNSILKFKVYVKYRLLLMLIFSLLIFIFI